MRSIITCEDCGRSGKAHGIIYFRGKYRCHACKLKASESICWGNLPIDTNHKTNEGRLVSGSHRPLPTDPTLSLRGIFQAIKRAVR
jgi:hypothetical protein